MTGAPIRLPRAVCHKADNGNRADGSDMEPTPMMACRTYLS
jgi:hypothetical protein